MIPVHDDNPTHLTPWLTWALIASCVLVFLWQSLSGDARFGAIIAGLGATPEVIFGRENAMEDGYLRRLIYMGEGAMGIYAPDNPVKTSVIAWTSHTMRRGPSAVRSAPG